MKCNYEVEYIYPTTLSFEEMKENICKKIARIIILNEMNIAYGNQDK